MFTEKERQVSIENEGKQWKLIFINLEILILYDYSRFYYLEILAFII